MCNTILYGCLVFFSSSSGVVISIIVLFYEKIHASSAPIQWKGVANAIKEKKKQQQQSKVEEKIAPKVVNKHTQHNITLLYIRYVTSIYYIMCLCGWILMLNSCFFCVFNIATALPLLMNLGRWFNFSGSRCAFTISR